MTVGSLRFDGDIRWIPVSQARMLLRVTRQRVYQLIGQGALVSMKVNESVLVSLRSVEARIALLRGERG
jgi:hypothetical protein